MRRLDIADLYLSLAQGHVAMLMLAVSISRSAGLQAPMDFLVELEEEGELEYEEAIIRL